MELGQLYHLQVAGGSPAIHGALLSLDSNGSLVIPSSSKNENNYATASIIRGQEPRTLEASSTAESGASHRSYCSLQGPSGKGIFQLQLSSATEVQGIGSDIRFDNWDVMSDGDYLFLRYKDLVGSGFWIAEPIENSDGEEVWVPWWLSPNGANAEDFKSYVMIDIELVKV